ncbi:MAG: FxsA family protein [Gammaproteobacteria bacterium]
MLVLIEVGGILGALPTVGLCIFTAALGTLLLRAQGIQTLRRAQNRIEHGEMPATDVIEGLILLVAGILLLTPGFMTDLIGFFCLIPGPRTRIATSILVWLIEQRKRGKTDNGDTVIIEGEFREETDETSHRVSHKQKQRDD